MRPSHLFWFDSVGGGEKKSNSGDGPSCVPLLLDLVKSTLSLESSPLYMYCRIDTEAAQDTTGRQQSNNVTLINPHVRRRFRSTFFFPLKLKLFQRWKRAFFSDRFLLLLLLSNNVFIIHPSRQEQQQQQEETILLVALGALLDREKFLSSCAGSRGESFFIFYRCLSNEPLVVSFFNFFSFFFFRPILPQRQITQSTCTIRSDPSHDTKDALEKRRHKKIDTHAIPARFLLLFFCPIARQQQQQQKTPR